MRMLIISTMFLLLTLGAVAEEFVTSATADLNSDKAADAISLTNARDGTSYTLTVGTARVVETLDARLNERAKGFQVVDLDRTDRFQEIAVALVGDSSESTRLYSFDGARINRMAELALLPSFHGTGIVYVQSWGGFWLRTDKYVLNAKTRTLTPQPFYYVGVEATVLVSLPIYAGETKKTIVAHLQPKSRVTILLNHGDWYLLKSTTGLTGWLPAAEITPQHFDDIPWGG